MSVAPPPAGDDQLRKPGQRGLTGKPPPPPGDAAGDAELTGCKPDAAPGTPHSCTKLGAKARRGSVGVLWRDGGRPGPLALRLLADALAWRYTSAFELALTMMLARNASWPVKHTTRSPH